MAENNLEGKTVITFKDGRKLEIKGKVVKPKELSCKNMPNIFFGTIKVNYSCGECGVSQSTRIKPQDYPVVPCEYCNTRNIFPFVIE